MSTSQGRTEPLCARITGLNQEVSEGKYDVGLTTVLFLPTRATRSGERARFVGLFQGYTGLWTAGCWLARRLHQIKASTTMDLGISIFLFFVQCMVLRNLDLLINLSGLLLRTLVVDRQQQYESIEVALDMEKGGLMNRFGIGRCHCL